MHDNLASARSIFEQNIRKNKEAGCNKTIFGQKAKTPSSSVVARRLFAHNNLSDDSNDSVNGSSSGDHHRRRSSVASQASANSSNHTVASIRRNSNRSQPRGQTTVEQRPEKDPETINHPIRRQPSNEKIPTTFPVKDAVFAKQQQDKIRSSIASLADHLGKLDIKSFKPRDDGGSIGSSIGSSLSSMDSHRDSFKLPDFRQSSYALSCTADRISKYNGTKKIPSNGLKGQGDASSNNSNSSLDVTDLCKGQASGSSSSLYKASKRDTSMNDSSRIRLKGSIRRATTDRLSTSNSKSPEFPPKHKAPSRHNKSLSQHLANSSNGRESWIRPSSIVEDDDSCSSSHHSQPFKSVPFTKAVIKRHREGLRPVARRESSATTRRESVNHKQVYSPNNSTQRLATTTRRRSSMGTTPKPRVPKPPPPDPEELALREEIEALQMQIKASETKLAQVEEGAQHELKRVQESKERKLKRIDATKKSTTTSVSPLSPQKAEALKEEYKQVKQTIRHIKQENAKIHNENRKLKLEIVTSRHSNCMLDESNVEMKQFVKELKAQQHAQVDEHDQLMSLATMYQKSILEVEEAMSRKNPERVKSERMRLEDKIDLLVSFMQEKCSDFALVEELTILAGFDDEGWEDTDTDDEEEEKKFKATFIGMPYQKEKVKIIDLSRRSVSDLLVVASSHSLHLFE